MTDDEELERKMEQLLTRVEYLINEFHADLQDLVETEVDRRCEDLIEEKVDEKLIELQVKSQLKSSQPNAGG